MANIYCGSVQYAAVAVWSTGMVGDSTANGGRGTYRRQTAPAVGSERVFRCTTSGTAAAGEPTWVITKNGTTTDGTITWTECTGQEADQTAALWKAPHARLTTAVAATWGAAGDTFYVAHDHAATVAAAVTITSPATSASHCQFICVNATTGSSMPPVSADLRTTGSESTTGANGLTLSGVGGGSSQFIGLTFSAGSGAVSSNLTLSTGSNYTTFKNCALKKLGTVSSSTAITVNNTSSASVGAMLFDNTQLFFGSTDDQFFPCATHFKWINTAVGVGGATLPTTLIRGVNNNYTNIISGVGFANLGSATLVSSGSGYGYNIFQNCTVASNAIVAGTPFYAAGADTYLLSSDSAGTNYRNEKYSYTGTQVVDTTLIRTGGATNGTTPTANKTTATANAKWVLPFDCMPLAVWNDTTAANVTVTVEGLQDPRTSVTLPNNDDVWFEVSYFGSSATPISTINTGTKADTLATGTALTASTQAWDSLVTARVNSSASAVGDRLKVASNAGRVFICTAVATDTLKAASEPAGYASAVDGGTVTDGNATFKAAVRFKQAITLSAPQPAMKGYIYVTPKIGKASGIYYIDPKPVLS